MSTADICMVHGTKLNKKGECEICLKFLKEVDEEEMNNSLEDFDDINPNGEDYEF